MGGNPSRFKGVDHPVENVSWDDSQKFIQELNDMEGREACRLPTEAEWEYAARAGSTSAYCFGDNIEQLKDYAWYDQNSRESMHPVGQLKPNAWSVYDIHGNVWEWVSDWYAVDYYQQSPENDPQGPDRGEYRVLPGGLFLHHLRDVRCTVRYGNHPVFGGGGVRIVVFPGL